MANVRQRRGFNPYARKDAAALAQRIGPYSKRIRGGAITRLKDGLFPDTQVTDDIVQFFINGVRFNEGFIDDTSLDTTSEPDGPYAPVTPHKGQFLYNGATGPRYMELSYTYDTDFARYDEWYRPNYLTGPNYVPAVYSGDDLRWFDHYDLLDTGATQHYHCGLITYKQAVAFHDGFAMEEAPYFSVVNSKDFVVPAITAGKAIAIEHDIWGFQFRWFRTIGGSNYAITETFVNDFPCWTKPQYVYTGNNNMLVFATLRDPENTRTRSRYELWSNVLSVTSSEENDEIRSAVCTSPYIYRIDTEAVTSTASFPARPTTAAGVPSTTGGGPFAIAMATCMGQGRALAYYVNLDVQLPADQHILQSGAIYRYWTVNHGDTWSIADVTQQFSDVSGENFLGVKIGRYYREEIPGVVMDTLTAFTHFSVIIPFNLLRVAIVSIMDYEYDPPDEVGYRKTTLHVSIDAGITFTTTEVPFLNITGGQTFNPTITSTGDPAYTQAQQRFYHPLWAVQTGPMSAIVLMQNSAVTNPQLSNQNRIYFLTTSDGFASYQRVVPSGLPIHMYRWLSKIQVTDYDSLLIAAYDYYGSEDLQIYESTDNGYNWVLRETLYEGFLLGGGNNVFYDIFMLRSWEWYPLLSVPNNRQPWYLSGSLFSNPVYGSIQPAPEPEPVSYNPNEAWKTE